MVQGWTNSEQQIGTESVHNPVEILPRGRAIRSSLSLEQTQPESKGIGRVFVILKLLKDVPAVLQVSRETRQNRHGCKADKEVTPLIRLHNMGQLKTLYASLRVTTCKHVSRTTWQSNNSCKIDYVFADFLTILRCWVLVLNGLRPAFLPH